MRRSHAFTSLPDPQLASSRLIGKFGGSFSQVVRPRQNDRLAYMSFVKKLLPLLLCADRRCDYVTKSLSVTEVIGWLSHCCAAFINRKRLLLPFGDHRSAIRFLLHCRFLHEECESEFCGPAQEQNSNRPIDCGEWGSSAEPSRSIQHSNTGTAL